MAAHDDLQQQQPPQQPPLDISATSLSSPPSLISPSPASPLPSTSLLQLQERLNKMFIRRATEAALTACLATQQVPYTTTPIEPYNLRVAFTPLAIAKPTTVAQIEKAVVCAADLGVKVNPRGGGHSYVSSGLGGENGHLVVDMSSFDAVSVGDDGVAKVGTGARLGEVAVALNDAGRGLSHGSCPGVGVGGHATHGGWGTSSHLKGLTIDWIRGATVTLANGTTVHASESCHPELLFAVRGAGSSFGVVSELEFDTFAAPTQVTPFSVTWHWADDLSDTAAAEAGIKGLQEWAESGAMPPEAWMNVFISQGAASSSGLYWGTQAETEAAVKDVLESLGGTYSSAATTDWIGQVEYFAGADTLVGPQFDTAHDTFYASSLATHGMTDAQVKSFVDKWFATQNPTPSTRSWWIQMDLHGGASSAIAKVPVDATAYPHRDKLLLWQFYDSVSAGTEYPANGFSLLQDLQASITDTMADGSWGRYANYPDSQVEGQLAAQQYYGSNLPRLRQIKSAVDAGDVFSNPQGVRPE